MPTQPNDIIILKSKEELDIYVTPQRQRLLRQMERSGRPVTPKQLSSKLNISASSVQHHIKKLEALGVVQLDHTEKINGITARYYALTPGLVGMGLLHNEPDDTARQILLQNTVNQVLAGFQRRLRRHGKAYAQRTQPGETSAEDVLRGVVHLPPERAKELMAGIRAFIHQHGKAGENTVPYEFALISYRADEEEDENDENEDKNEG